MKNTLFIISFFISFFLMLSCETPNSDEKQISTYDQAVTYSVEKMIKSLEEVRLGKYPIITKGLGEWELTEPEAWTSGFYPGCLWYANQLSQNSKLLESAIKFTEGLKDQQYNTNHHDIGFMILNSYGLGYNHTEKEEYRNIILQSANSLATRFNPIVGCIQSWDGDFQVIIDNMMNLEILIWAAKNGGNKDLYNIAVSHADKTIENHLRKDGGSYHVVHFDPAKGEVIKKRTHQGYADNSTWARGQAWGIYGFTMMYRETQDSKYLETATKMANYFIANLPEDYIPYWDFNLPESSDRKYKDASAATIALSALLELRYYIDNKSKYDSVIENIFNSLINNYISINTNSSGIINHCAYNANSNKQYDWDASTSWGDYYFLESLVRYKNFK